METKQKTRADIAPEYKWKLEDIFATDEDWEREFEDVKKKLPAVNSYAAKLSLSAGYLLQCLNKMHDLEERIGKLFAYAHMRNDEDKSATRYQEQYDRSRTLLVEYNQTVAFFEPEVLSIPEGRFEQYYLDEPDLKLYRHFFDDIRRKKAHTLSDKEERLMALSGEVRHAPAEIFGVWESADIVFPKIQDDRGNEVHISNALYNKFQQSPDRRLRKDAYMGLYVPFIEHRNMLASNYAAIVKSHLFNARARGYHNTLEAALDANNIPTKIYHNLIEQTRRHLEPLQRYNRLRQKVLKLDDGVHDYDLRAPLFSEQNRDYNWEEAKQLCKEGMQPLGADYNEHLQMAFNERWIDVYENKGKRTGAYSSGTYGVHPYVLMNYNNTIGDVFTLAHEMGHAMHTYYTINNQPYVYGDYPIFLAEVASTANEALLQKYLIDTAESDEQKRLFLNSYLDKFSQTFYRQIIFAEFEWRSHQLVEEGQALSADRLDALFGEIYQHYHGETFVLDREIKALWSRVPHFYYNFYVFQYSTSFAASLTLVSRILQEGAPARDRFLNFLKSGRSKYPIDTLSEAGVNMDSEEPFIHTVEWMNRLLDQLEKLL